MDKKISLRTLLWIDGAAALLVSTAILLLSSRLATLFNMPEWLLQTLAIIGLVFAAYSLNLARKPTHSRHVLLLTVANASYAALALGVAIYYLNKASIYGTIYFFLEVVFIGLLALLEWRKIKE